MAYLAIVTTSVLPGAIALGAVVSQIQSRLGPGWAVGSFLISFTSALLLHPLWVPVLRGLPDVIGLPVTGAERWPRFFGPRIGLR